MLVFVGLGELALLEISAVPLLLTNQVLGPPSSGRGDPCLPDTSELTEPYQAVIELEVENRRQTAGGIKVAREC